MSEAGPWLTLVGLGAFHGVNPAMGWLFAVALGLQERSGRAIGRALAPIAIGHAASVGLTLVLLGIGRASIPIAILEWLTAGALIGFGILKLVRPRHPRWVGMVVGFRDLLLWSFLMATAHGAGLMLIPVFLFGADDPAPCHGTSCHAAAGLPLDSWAGYLAAIGIHTLAMLVAAGLVAFIIYYKVGVAVLRRAWINLDHVWAAALILAGLAAIIL